MAGAFAIGLLFAPTAGASVTLGSDLAVVPDSSVSCGAPPCSLSQTALPGRIVTSPVNGTVVRWGVWLSSTGAARLRVIRPMGAGALFLSASATEPVPNGVTPFYFTTSLPIAIGDRIALDDLGVDAGDPNGVVTAGASVDGFNPAPATGASGTATPASTGIDLGLNADIEPTGQFTIAGTKAQAKKGTATLTTALPNPGTLTTSSSLTKPVSMTVAGPGDATLKLLPTKATKKRLRKRGKASGPINLTFAPSFGTAVTVGTHVKLKLKLK